MDLSSWTPVDIANYSLYAVAYISSIVAFSMTRIEWLRIIIIVSSTCYAIYYYLVPAEPLWLDVITEGGFVLLNVFMLCVVAWHSSRTKLNDQEQHLHQSLFTDLSKHEFARILKPATWDVHEAGDILISDGETSDTIYFLFSGETEVDMPDGNRHVRKAGTILGEIGYQLQQPASGTVTVKERSVSVRWKHAALRKLCKRSPGIKAAIDTMLSERMAMKLAN